MKEFLRCCFTLLFITYCCRFSYAQVESVKNDSSAEEININLNLSEVVSDDDVKRERADSVLQAINDMDNLVKFSKSWKFKTGDDSLWASPNYDDSNWEIEDRDFSKVKKELPNDSLKPKKEPVGITWYRIHFQIDSTLWEVPLAFYLHQFGSAAEVYLDGKFLKSYGKVGKNKESEVAEFSINPKPYAVVFAKSKDHILAVRYSNFHRSEARGKGLSLGKNFRISIKDLNEEIKDVADLSKYFPIIFLAGIFITLAVVHFILFIFNRQRVANIYYSLYCLCVFFVLFYAYYIITSTDYSSITLLSRTAQFLGPLLIIPLVALMHTIFYEKLLKIFWFLFLLYLISLVLIFINKDKPALGIDIILFFISMIEILRVIIKAVWKKKDGAYIFALVVLLAPIIGIVASFLPDEFSLSGIKIAVDSGALVLYSFILGLPLSMTLYLARDFARMGKKLKNQLYEIMTLSEKTIQQEKEKKIILENQKSELENKVVERTREVMQQKEVIEIKNKEITESLRYAKRIQSAILPDIKLIYKALEKSFVLYLPKDIVSGDFYGFAQKNNRVIIAAADCTGHGVSGAFMSMIGSSLLNQIINEKHITEPSSILNQLNEGIIASLKQKESESNDGMDIALCAFDLINHILYFSGANRPLWIIRDNNLLVYKPDKLPIGGLQIIGERKFTQHAIPLQKDDTIYIFSDGFSDQFGGEKGKKLMTKKFKDTLLDIQKLSMSDQEQYLSNLFETWKGSHEQVDDVLVIGIKI